MKDFKDLLANHQIDPKSVLMLRHTAPSYLRRPRQRKEFLDLLETHPDALNAYQQTQEQSVEERMRRSQFAASFVGDAPGSAVFIGLYRRLGESERTAVDINSDPAVQLLLKYDLDRETRTRNWFDLHLVKEFYPEWKGKLRIKWPGREINWHRFADSDDFEIIAVPSGRSVDARGLNLQQPPQLN